MPIDEYKCNDCGEKFEELVNSADEIAPCPKCESTSVEKLLSAPAVSVSSSGAAGCSPSAGT